MAVSSLKAKFEDLKEKFDGTLAEKSTLEQAVRKEELDRARKEAAIVKREKSTDFYNVAVLNQHAALKLKLKTHSDEMVCNSFFENKTNIMIYTPKNDIIRDRDALKTQLTEITIHYNKLYDESKFLIHNLERKEHDLNYLQDKLARTDRGKLFQAHLCCTRLISILDNEGSFHMELRRMQNEVREAMKEKDRVQTMWVDERENALKLKDVVKQMEVQKAFLDVIYQFHGDASNF